MALLIEHATIKDEEKAARGALKRMEEEPGAQEYEGEYALVLGGNGKHWYADMAQLNAFGKGSKG